MARRTPPEKPKKLNKWEEKYLPFKLHEEYVRKLILAQELKSVESPIIADSNPETTIVSPSNNINGIKPSKRIQKKPRITKNQKKQ